MGKEEFEQAVEQIESDFETSWNTIVCLAEAGLEEAMEFVALSYYRGRYVPMDEPLALEWFEKIVKRYPENGSVWYKIGDCYFYGYGVGVDQEESIKYYTIAWEKGVADAGSDIGWIYAYGDIAQKSEETAAKWFQRAADKGSVQGMYFMGFFYAEGLGGLPVNEKIAEKYLIQAAEADNLPAVRYLLGKKCYGDTDVFSRMQAKLVGIAEGGNDTAQYALGMAYWLGEDWEMAYGFERDRLKSQKWLELAAKQGNADAAYYLGQGLVDYDSGFIVDIDSGEKYLLEAVEKGKSEACYDLARLYTWDKPDSQKRLYWSEEAVKNGNTSLVHDVAESYFNGEGTNIDYGRAAGYYLKCIQDNPEYVESVLSYLPLAKCYLLGGELENDRYGKAAQYLNLALEAADRNEYARSTRGEVEYWIAYMYDKGLGMRQNLEEAYKHYTKSSEAGFTKAQEELPHFRKTLFGWKKM